MSKGFQTGNAFNIVVGRPAYQRDMIICIGTLVKNKPHIFHPSTHQEWQKILG